MMNNIIFYNPVQTICLGKLQYGALYYYTFNVFATLNLVLSKYGIHTKRFLHGINFFA